MLTANGKFFHLHHGTVILIHHINLANLMCRIYIVEPPAWGFRELGEWDQNNQGAGSRMEKSEGSRSRGKSLGSREQRKLNMEQLKNS